MNGASQAKPNRTTKARNMKKLFPILLLLAACQKEVPSPSPCYSCTVSVETHKLNGIVSRGQSAFTVCGWTSDSARAFERANTWSDSIDLYGWETAQVTKCQNN